MQCASSLSRPCTTPTVSVRNVSGKTACSNFHQARTSSLNGCVIVDCHYVNPDMLYIFLLDLVKPDLPTLRVCVLHEASFSNHSSCGYCLLQMLATVSGHVQPCLFVCFALNLWYSLPALSHSTHLPFYPHHVLLSFWCPSSAGCPCREPCTCVLFRPFCICFFFVSTGFVGSLRNPHFISLYPCFSAQTFQNFALDNMIIMFFTSSAQVPV